MKFNTLRISNLRAVEKFEVEDLSSFVVIAGQNGSGKSCVFDAIRLLKSLYGGYSANEYHQWFGEFAINVNDRRTLTRMFRDPDQPLEVQAQLEFSEAERRYVQENAAELALPIAWQRVTGQTIDHYRFNQISVATQLEAIRPQVDQVVGELVAQVQNANGELKHELAVTIHPTGELSLDPSHIVQLAFQTYKPDSLGVIEYHSASRAYTRQDVGGINLDSRAFEDQRRQSGLYNWQSKYQNVKTELASGYIRDLIASASGAASQRDDLNDTMSELFRTFFPDKEYLGVRPLEAGTLEFPVRVPGGRTHDIDDLSSGEKEILYGYLRLRNSTPKGSILLLDEPELHLNPSLLHGFADFYYRHLGVAQGNQLWLVTHSDTLLRQAVGNSNYRVYHMTPASANDSGENQAKEVHLHDDLERAVVDLVGDLAGYRPSAKVLILEGEPDGDGVDGFDATVVRRLFPMVAKRVNLVSGGNKARVRGLYEILSSSAAQLGASNRFYSITDLDRGAQSESIHSTSWDRYHIENYLLEPRFIRAVVQSVEGREVFATDEDALDALRRSALEIVDQIAIEIVQDEINQQVIRAVAIGASPSASSPSVQLAASLQGSVARIQQVGAEFDEAALAERLQLERERLLESCQSMDWLVRIPGRLVLKRFVRDHAGVKYEAFVNLLLDRMAEANWEPPGMKTVLERIVAS